jgi:ABC-2 type transport system ATP-binding protein
MEEAERLADRIAVIAAGEIVAEGPPQTLGGRRQGAAQIAFSPLDGTSGTELPASLAARVAQQPGGRLLLASTRVAADLYALAGWALEHGLELDDLEVSRPTLEDVYLQLTTETNDDPERADHDLAAQVARSQVARAHHQP